MIRFDPGVAEALVAYCRAELPIEACGYLVGEGEHVERFLPLRNAAGSPTRFELDPYEQLAAERALEEAGEVVVGVAHSHPAGENTPSGTDLADAARFDPLGAWIHVIVQPTSESIRAFRLLDGAAEELEVET